MNILIIPEDFRKDQYILKPLFTRLFRSIGKPRVRIEICRDPLLGGVGEALRDCFKIHVAPFQLCAIALSF